MTTRYIYLAARFERKDEMLKYAYELTQLGHRVTSLWIQTQATREDEERKKGLASTIALKNIRDLRNADTLVIFSENKGERIAYGGGRYFELGYAYAEGLDIWLVGEPEMLFMNLPDIHVVASVAELCERLGDG